MKRLIYLSLLLFCFSLAKSQTTYSSSTITYSPDPFTNGTAISLFDDVFSSVIPLPFNFCFYDSSYNEVVIGSNGIITFDTSFANDYCPWPASGPVPYNAYPDHSIMAPFQDINPGAGGTIKYDVQGVAPYRRFIVSYYQIPMFSCNSIFFSEQVILYETSNFIEMHIEDKPLCSTWNGGAAILGMQEDSSNGIAAPGMNYPNQWTATLEAWRFTPTGPCAGPAPADSITGKVFADYNNNCSQDPGEFPLANRAVIANSGQFYGWTDANGEYEIGVVPGTYAVNEYMPAPFFASNCVANGTYNLTLNGNIASGTDFADSAAVICSDLFIDIGSGGLRRCSQSMINATYCNLGTYPDSNAVVTITLNDSLQIDSSNVPYTNPSLNVYEFNVGLLMPGQCGNINLTVDVGCDTAGTMYCMNASIAGSYPNDCNLYNNIALDCQALVAPLDPNEKRVAAQNFAQQGYVLEDTVEPSDELTYQINFQNLGTSYAEDVEIRDTLDAGIAPESVQPGAASASYNYFVQGNVIVFRFENIFLPDSTSDEPGSHGFVKFMVEQRPGNVPGTVIQNTASIYFDFEAPVVTNTTQNFVRIPTQITPGLMNAVKIYPNPGHDQFVVEALVDVELQLVMFDITGKELKRIDLEGLRQTVNTSDLETGLYLYQIQSEGKTVEVGKWLKH